LIEAGGKEKIMLVGFVIRQQPLSVLPHRLKASMFGREPCTGFILSAKESMFCIII